MKIYFMTGNKNKLAEAQEILKEHEVVQKEFDLPEIQSLDIEEIITEKLAAALAMTMGEEAALMVEDTGFWVGDTGLPGPFIKFFWKTIGREGIVKFAKTFGAESARVECHVGLFISGSKKPDFFVGIVEGSICEPRGESGFGFDPIFIPAGQEKTYAEMGEEKHAISHRKLALEQVHEFLKKT